MELNWIRAEDERPIDNGGIQKFLVCTNRPTSSFGNCNISMAYFTNKSHLDKGVKVTHWVKVEKPNEYK